MNKFKFVSTNENVFSFIFIHLTPFPSGVRQKWNKNFWKLTIIISLLFISTAYSMNIQHVSQSNCLLFLTRAPSDFIKQAAELYQVSNKR